jgi:hypothetical protein
MACETHEDGEFVGIQIGMFPELRPVSHLRSRRDLLYVRHYTPQKKHFAPRIELQYMVQSSTTFRIIHLSN